MNYAIRCVLLCLLLVVGTGKTVHAQDTSKVAKEVVIETKDGVTISGVVQSEDNTQVVIITKSLGTVTVQKSNIKSMREISDEDKVKGEYWFENPNCTRYVIGPSAIPLRKKEGYYQNLYIFLQSVNVGITDNISIGGGTEIASVLFGQEPPAFIFLTPKYGTQVAPKIHVGGGVLYLGFPRFSWFGSGRGMAHYGIGYGLFTYGNRNNNLTLGLGWSFTSVVESTYLGSGNYRNDRVNEFSKRPVFTISGMLRPRKRFGLVSENWIYPYKESNYTYNPSGPATITYDYKYMLYFSYGMRFMGEKICIDLGFVNTPELAQDIFIGIPYIDFVIKFGGKRRDPKIK